MNQMVPPAICSALWRSGQTGGLSAKAIANTDSLGNDCPATAGTAIRSLEGCAAARLASPVIMQPARIAHDFIATSRHGLHETTGKNCDQSMVQKESRGASVQIY